MRSLEKGYQLGDCRDSVCELLGEIKDDLLKTVKEYPFEFDSLRSQMFPVNNSKIHDEWGKSRLCAKYIGSILKCSYPEDSKSVVAKYRSDLKVLKPVVAKYFKVVRNLVGNKDEYISFISNEFHHLSNCSIDDANIPDEQVFAEFGWLKWNLERDEDLDEKSRNKIMFVCKILSESMIKIRIEYHAKISKMENDINMIFADSACRGHSSFGEFQISANINCFLEKLQGCEGCNFKRDELSSYIFTTSNGVLKFSVGVRDGNGSSYIGKIGYNYDCILGSEFERYQKILNILGEFRDFLISNV